MPLLPPGGVLPKVDFATVGPAVGVRFPDLTLPNQHGEQVELHERRAGRRAAVIFHRSADW